MNIAFIVDTPYQTLNALNLFWGNYHRKKNVTADLYIVDQFRNAHQIYERILEKKLFDNVYFLRWEENRHMPQGWKRSLRVAYSYLNPKHAVRNQFDGPMPKEKYDAIFASVMSCFVASMIKLNSKADFMLFDDGTGSYSGNLVANGGGKAYKLFSKLTGTGANSARAKKLFVNNVPMCHSTSADEICAMPKFRQDFLDVAYQIFSVAKQTELTAGIVLLSHPGDNAPLDKCMQDNVDWIRPWKDRVIVRMHPRDRAYQRYLDFEVDDKGEMWELKISQMDMDRVLLVGNYSTAQMTPKMLYDKEPWLMFTFFMNDPEGQLGEGHPVHALINSYTHKERILFPRSEEELAYQMNRFLNQG